MVQKHSSTTAHANAAATTGSNNTFGIAANKVVQTDSEGDLVGSNTIPIGTSGYLLEPASLSDGVVGADTGDVVLSVTDASKDFWVGNGSDRFIVASKDRLTVFGTSVSTSKTSGGLVVPSSGIGVVGNSFFGGTISTDDTTNSTSASTGSIRTSGGISCAKDLWVGQSLFLPTSGGTPLGLASYEVITHATTFTGAFTSASQDVTFLKLGRLVMCQWPSFTGTSGAAATLTSTTLFPARFRPPTDLAFGINITDNSAVIIGTCKITTAGAVVFHVDNDTTFTNGGTAGPRGGCVSYIVDA